MAKAAMLKNIENITRYLHFQHTISIGHAALMSRNRV